MASLLVNNISKLITFTSPNNNNNSGLISTFINAATNAIDAIPPSTNHGVGSARALR
jgi:hypothetical protein